MNTVVLLNSVKEFIEKLGPINKKVIYHKIEFLRESSFSDIYDRSEKLKGYDQTFRIRAGNFRILFKSFEKKIVICNIDDRKDVYR